MVPKAGRIHINHVNVILAHFRVAGLLSGGLLTVLSISMLGFSFFMRLSFLFASREDSLKAAVKKDWVRD